METGTSPRELFWVSGTGPREQSGPRIIVSVPDLYVEIDHKATSLIFYKSFQELLGN